MNLAQILALTEDQARDYLESVRWPSGPGCPKCGDTNVVKLQGKSTRPGVYKCRGCRKPFTVTVGTIFHRSHIPLRLWLGAFHLICSSKKGISALQLQRNLGLGSYQSAWHMAHRIRHAMQNEPLRSMLSGDIEADETYVGGKPRNRHKSNMGKYRDFKTPVVALVQRGGEVRARVVANVTTANVRAMIDEYVGDKSGRLMTDEARVYRAPGKEFDGGHHFTKHSLGEYLRGEVHSNTVESYFSLIERSIMGAWHHVSKEHLGRYVDEVSFRWNTRKTTDGERTVLALQGADGKRLTYRETKGGQNLTA